MRKTKYTKKPRDCWAHGASKIFEKYFLIMLKRRLSFGQRQNGRDLSSCFSQRNECYIYLPRVPFCIFLCIPVVSIKGNNITFCYCKRTRISHCKSTLMICAASRNPKTVVAVSCAVNHDYKSICWNNVSKITELSVPLMQAQVYKLYTMSPIVFWNRSTNFMSI